ncbi:hypothetical protein [Pseudofrankia inefficax]|uniref:Integral membrane protein n=1 Tax=Pseudofrankia inefficax (strain DSM 45817 / CECT 9037 / DDB 130130 / EuI1c) TaxID=298654 RepID=E3IW08_PSEI1|nr:hypothetical protein [Pseudofrankia inefficax]ADP84936.1 integral membrane protein [Pseudofrankia inefficax]
MSAWHVDDDALARWVDGTETFAQAASSEAHLLVCAPCRARVAGAVRARPSLAERAELPELDAVWMNVRDVIELPEVPAFERLLRRVGLPPADARLVTLAPAFRVPWLAGILLVLAFALIATQFAHGRGQVVFLMVAPLLPCVAVALSYDPSIEPAVETELATPYPALRLVLLRCLAVLGVGLPAAVVVSAFLPGNISYLWLLPSLGFVGCVLAASTWTTPLSAAAGISVVWFLITLGTALAGSARAVLRPAYLGGYLALAVVSVVVLLARHRHLRQPRAGGGWV